MVRMSDIFKQKKDYPPEPSKESQDKNLIVDKPSQEDLKKKTDEKTELQKETKETIEKKEEQPKEKVISFSLKEPSQIMKESLKIEDRQKTEELYNQTTELVKEILNKVRKQESIEVKKIREIVEKLIDQLILGNSELIGLVRRSTPENYLYGHSTNVCILSIVVGLGLNYDKGRLIELGIASLLHDIGMTKVSNISDKPDKLTDEEYNKIKEHPNFGVEMLELSKDISQQAIDVAQEHHEWVNGTGYPRGLKGEQINDYAKIVATVDVYEALTHTRPHRASLLAFDAIKDLLRNKEHFASNFLKVLIEQMGIYPIGSLVQLSDNEIARVIKINKFNPLRPIVEIILDSQGQRQTEYKSIDLSKTPNLNIKKPVHENEVHPV